VKLGGPLKEKCLCIKVTLGLFESKVFTHYSCYWGPFESVVILLTHYICHCGPLCKCRTYILHLLLGALWKRSEPSYILHLLLWASLKS